MEDRHHHDHAADGIEDVSPSKRFWRHVKAPCNIGSCTDVDALATAVGSCGDKISVGLRIKGETLTEVKCQPDGCVFTVVCASAMSVLATGRTLDDALLLQPEDVVRELEWLPDDHLHCARLAINTLGEAIADYYRRERTAFDLK
jgi:nitrogen fixation NifU-like protein